MALAFPEATAEKVLRLDKRKTGVT